jgi:hypothetical protein
LVVLPRFCQYRVVCKLQRFEASVFRGQTFDIVCLWAVLQSFVDADHGIYYVLHRISRYNQLDIAMKPIIKMMLYIVAVAAFIKFVPMLLMHNGTYVEIKINSEKLGIDNSTLFYSEEPRTSIAERELSASLSDAKE